MRSTEGILCGCFDPRFGWGSDFCTSEGDIGIHLPCLGTGFIYPTDDFRARVKRLSELRPQTHTVRFQAANLRTPYAVRILALLEIKTELFWAHNLYGNPNILSYAGQVCAGAYDLEIKNLQAAQAASLEAHRKTREKVGTSLKDKKTWTAIELALGGSLDEAEQLLLEITRTDPTDAAAYNNVGWFVLNYRQDSVSAFLWQCEAYQLDPNAVHAYKLAVCLSCMNQHVAAMQFLERARNTPDYPMISTRNEELAGNLKGYTQESPS